MSLWGIKYADTDERWWVDIVLQDTPPKVRLDQIGGRVLAAGFDSVTGPVLVHRASVPADALSDWPSDTPVVLEPVERTRPAAESAL